MCIRDSKKGMRGDDAKPTARIGDDARPPAEGTSPPENARDRDDAAR